MSEEIKQEIPKHEYSNIGFCIHCSLARSFLEKSKQPCLSESQRAERLAGIAKCQAEHEQIKAQASRVERPAQPEPREKSDAVMAEKSYTQPVSARVALLVGAAILLALELYLILGPYGPSAAKKRIAERSQTTINAGGKPCEVCGRPAVPVTYSGVGLGSLKGERWCREHAPATLHIGGDWQPMLFWLVGWACLVLAPIWPCVAIRDAVKGNSDSWKDRVFITGLTLFFLVIGLYTLSFRYF